MGATISIEAYSGKESEEFKKHLKAVKFCIENDLSYPKETSEFFKGKVSDGYGLEDITRDSILEYIENGVSVPLKTHGDENGNEIRIKISDIPSEVDEIVVSSL